MRNNNICLPMGWYKDGITAQLDDEALELATNLSIAFDDCPTWSARAAKVNAWACRVAAQDGGSGLPDAVGVLSTLLEARQDRAVSCADHAGLLLASIDEDWRFNARHWFQQEGPGVLEAWLDRHHGVCAMILLFIQANIAAGMPVPVEAECPAE